MKKNIILSFSYFLKNKKNLIIEHLKEIKDISKNIVYPKIAQLQKTFLIVILFCAIFGLTIWLIDKIIILIVKKILN